MITILIFINSSTYLSQLYFKFCSLRELNQLLKLFEELNP